MAMKIKLISNYSDSSCLIFQVKCQIFSHSIHIGIKAMQILNYVLKLELPFVLLYLLYMYMFNTSSANINERYAQTGT